MKTFDLNKFGTVYPIQLNVATYPEGNLAITMTVWKDNIPKPWNVLTVNLPGIREKDCAFIDTNNNGNDIFAWIIRNGLGVPTGRMQQSGFCTYPEFHFRPEVLQDIDPDGYADYLQGQIVGC